MKLNKEVEDELEKQFPKGDKARGRALVLHAIAQIELNEKDKEIRKLKGILDDSDIVYGKDAKRFIKKMEQEEKGKLSKEDKAMMKNFLEFIRNRGVEELKYGTK